MDWSLPGSSVHEIFQARLLEWVAISFSRGSSRPRDRTCVSCIGRWILYHCSNRLSFLTEASFSALLSGFAVAEAKHSLVSRMSSWITGQPASGALRTTLKVRGPSAPAGHRYWGARWQQAGCIWMFLLFQQLIQAWPGTPSSFLLTAMAPAPWDPFCLWEGPESGGHPNPTASESREKAC